MAQRKKKGSSPAAQQMQFNNALMADVRALRQEIAKGRNAQPSRVAKKRPGRTRTRNEGRIGSGGQVGAAVIIRQPFIGLSDLRAHKCSWVAGTVYVGDGTLGAANGLYLRTPITNPAADNGYTVTPMVPVAPADQYLGASYMQFLERFYRRKRFNKLVAHFRPIRTSTSNDISLSVAPMRGPPGTNETIVGSMSTVAATSQIGVMSITGTKTVDGFIPTSLDLTPYIASGSGPKQNEFANSATSAGGTWLNNASTSGLGSCPCAFYVAGSSTVTALQGADVMVVSIEAEMDWLDFVGGLPLPVGGEDLVESRDEKRKRLMSELASLVRNDNHRELSPARIP